MLDATQILECATRPDGPLAYIREEAEAPATAEAEAAEAASASHQAEAEATLHEARQACATAEETYFKHCLKIPALQEKSRTSRERYKAAQRRVRDLGIAESGPLLPLGTGSYEHRKQAEQITLAFRRGL